MDDTDDDLKVAMRLNNDIALVEATTQIVCAAINSRVVTNADEVANWIGKVFDKFANAIGGTPTPESRAAKLEPAVPIKKSVHDDYIVCLEDGKKFKSLKRHISSYYGLSPDEYRQKWGLPADYPMVAPNYAAQRSSLAKKMGLGKSRSVN